jgi:hypothetical protein
MGISTGHTTRADLKARRREQIRGILNNNQGHEFAITVKEIADELGVKLRHDTGSEIRILIRELIADGEPIGSGHDGYYRITCKEELDDYLESLQGRIDAIQDRIVDVSNAYTSEMDDRHLNTRIPIKDRCRYFAIFLAEKLNLPYQAVYTMAYRKLSKETGVDLVNLPKHYRGSVLNYISNRGMGAELYDVLAILESALV